MYSFAHYLFIMRGVDEVGVLVVYLQQIQYHAPNQLGQGDNLSKDGVIAKLSWGGNIEGQADYQEK